MLLRLVLVIKDKTFVNFLNKYFDDSNVWIDSIGHFKNPLQKVLQTNGDVFLIDTKLFPKHIDSTLALLNDLPENPTIVVLSENNSPKKHAEFITWGADIVLYAGLPMENLGEAIMSTIESRLQLVQRSMPGERAFMPARLSSFIADSPKMKIFMNVLQKVISCNTPVLLLGETGVGKEHLSKIIHYEGPRAGGPFIAVNCAALPETLLESELFGHEKGAFTGAVRTRRGAFELAHGGTIFLDEIAELPAHMQAKLLRVLQEHEICPLGSEKTMWVDIRVIAATNRNIEQSIKEGSFRQDLYYRLSVFSLVIPPLRERVEDIPVIANRYLIDFSKKLNKKIKGITEPALKALMRYEWPGNIRELINVIERAAILCQGDMVKLEDLPEGIGLYEPQNLSSDAFANSILSEWRHKSLAEIKQQTFEIVEKSYLELVLKETSGKLGDAAKMAGIHPRGLYNKMKKYNLRKEDFKLYRK